MNSNIKKYLVGLLLGLFLCGSFFGGVYWGQNRQYKKDQTTQIELETQINILQNKLESIQEADNELFYQKDSLETKLSEVEKNLVQLQKTYDKKISSIVEYSNLELEQFFRERYSSD